MPVYGKVWKIINVETISVNVFWMSFWFYLCANSLGWGEQLVTLSIPFRMSLFAGDLVVIFHSHHLGSYKKVSSKQASENNKEKEYRNFVSLKTSPCRHHPVNTAWLTVTDCSFL